MQYAKLSLLIIGTALFLQSCGSSQEVVKPEVTGLAADTLKSVSESTSASPAAVNGASNSLEPVLLIGKKGSDEAFPALSADGKQLVYQKRTEGNNWQIWLYDFGRDSSEVIYSSAGNAETPFFAPDGQKIVFTCDLDGSEYTGGSKSRDLFLMDNDGHNVKKLTDSKSDNWHPVFSADGKKIYFASNRNDSEQKYYDETAAVFAYDITTGKTEEILPTVDYKNNPAISPDGKLLAYTGKENKLLMLNPDNQSGSREISDAESQSGGAFFHADGSRLFYHNLTKDKFEIRCYYLAGDSSAVVVSGLNNARSPFVHENKIYFHSNQAGDYNIYLKQLP